MPGLPDLYAILEVDAAADALAVRTAYRRLARQHHPDRGGSSKRMARLNAAYAILRDPSMRAGYDAARRQLAAEDRAPRSAPEAERHAQAGYPAGTGYRPGTGTRVTGGPAGPTVVAEGPLTRARARAGAGDGARSDASGRGRERDAEWLAGTAAGSAESGWRTGAAFGGLGGQRSGARSGRMLDFGRYEGWTIAQVARSDPDFLEWLERMPVGRQYRTEIDTCLREVGHRPSVEGAAEHAARPVPTFAKAARSRRLDRMPRFAVLRRG
ncbi:MAG TPA: DnaJ domain-containing protein [Candidatus Limnocylindrales bacterium]|nr:DnaJ domain-containing protein [Candidatus Limnocylindrales bacterium]